MFAGYKKLRYEPHPAMLDRKYNRSGHLLGLSKKLSRCIEVKRCILFTHERENVIPILYLLV